MLEAKLTIEAPGLTQALNRLADALAHRAPEAAAPAPEVPAPVNPPPPEPGVPASVFSAPVVPVAATPAFTHEQVGKAGADLLAVEPGKMPQLLALLQQHGVRAITELPEDQLGAFATALRGLGAKL